MAGPASNTRNNRRGRVESEGPNPRIQVEEVARSPDVEMSEGEVFDNGDGRHERDEHREGGVRMPNDPRDDPVVRGLIAEAVRSARDDWEQAPQAPRSAQEGTDREAQPSGEVTSLTGSLPFRSVASQKGKEAERVERDVDVQMANAPTQGGGMVNSEGQSVVDWADDTPPQDMDPDEEVNLLKAQIAKHKRKLELERLRKELTDLREGKVPSLEGGKPPPINTKGFHKPDQYVRSSINKWRIWFQGAEAYLRATKYWEHGDAEVMAWLQTMMGENVRVDWTGDQEAGKTMPTTFAEFKQWARDRIDNPERRGLKAHSKWMNARMRPEQTGLEFMDLMETLTSDLESKNDFEKLNVDQIINSLSEPWRIKLYESPRPSPKSMAELRSELARLEDVMPAKASAPSDRRPEAPKRGADSQGPSGSSQNKKPKHGGQTEGSKRPGNSDGKKPPRSHRAFFGIVGDEELDRREKAGLCLRCGGRCRGGWRSCRNEIVTDAKGPKSSQVSGRVRALREAQVDPDPEIGNPDAPEDARGMYVNATVHTPSTREFTALTLLDTGTDGSITSRRLANVLTSGKYDTPVGKLELADGSRAVHYGVYSLDVEVEDSLGVRRRVRKNSAVMDLPREGPQVYLGFDWFEELNPQVDWRSRRFSFPRELPIEVLSIGRFIRAAQKERRETYILAGHEYSELTAQLPLELHDLADVFAEGREGDLVDPVVQAHHAIDLVDGKMPPWLPIYNMSAKELAVLREYIESSLKKGWIRESKSPVGAPVLFAPKSDGGLRLSVDYRGLNERTIKNRYPLPLVDEMLDRLSGAKVFSKIDVRDAYHRIPIREGDQWKTAFRTRYGHFEYLVMPFGLANAPATFQAYIHRALAGLVDIVCIVYLDDILVFSNNENEHWGHVQEVLKRLRDAKLYCKLSKCLFNQKQIHFLGYVVSAEGISMEPERVATIVEWPVPKSYHDIQVFLGFANFYRRFIHKYSSITAPITELLKGMEKGRKKGPFIWTPAADAAFEDLKEAFVKGPMIRHWDPEKPCRLETDASGFGGAAVLSQYFVDEKGVGRWHPIAFYSFKFDGPQSRYSTPDQEMLVVVKAFEHRRHYLEGGVTTLVLTDHGNLQSFMKSSHKLTNRRQVAWLEKLAAYDFEIKYRTGNTNPADGPSRRPDYKRGNDFIEHPFPTLERKEWYQNLIEDDPDKVPNPSERVTAVVRNVSRVPANTTGTSSATDGAAHRVKAATHETVPLYVEPGVGGLVHLTPRVRVVRATHAETAITEPQGSTVELIANAQERDAWTVNLLEDIRGNRAGEEWMVGSENGLLYHRATESKKGKHRGTSNNADGSPRYSLVAPRDPSLRAELLRIHHDDPWGGHFGVEKTDALLRRKYHWPGRYEDVKEYVKSCQTCELARSPRHKPYGELQPLQAPTEPFQSITMDMITGLPPVTRSGKVFDAILVVVDRFTKFARYIPCSKKLAAPDLFDLLDREWFKRFGYPEEIITDRGSVFSSDYWKTVCFYIKVRRNMSTAYHPQSDGQTEIQNQILEHYLRCYVSFKQNDWPDWLQDAEVAYNRSMHSSTGMSPYYASFGKEPRFVDDELAPPSSNEPQGPRARLEALAESRRFLQEELAKARESQSKYYNQHRTPMEFEVGDQVSLSGKNLRSKRPNKKLDNKRYGPFKITEKIGRNAYRLELPSTYGIHPVFHVSLLEPFHIREGEEPKRPPPVLLHDAEAWDVEKVLNDKMYRKQRYYLVRWEEYPPEEDTWEPETALAEDAPESIEDYWHEQGMEPPESFNKARQAASRREAEEAARNNEGKEAPPSSRSGKQSKGKGKKVSKRGKKKSSRGRA